MRSYRNVSGGLAAALATALILVVPALAVPAGDTRAWVMGNSAPRAVAIDGWFAWDTLRTRGVAGRASSQRWFSGEFRAAARGTAWHHAGGTIDANVRVSGCGDSNLAVTVSLVRTVGGLVTSSFPVSLDCGSNPQRFGWGHHTAGTYHLEFERHSDTGQDNELRRVDGSLTSRHA